MTKLSLLYATNRKHEGRDRWNPTSYGRKFSDDGLENLRFGEVVLSAEEDEIGKHLARKTDLGPGDGERLAKYLAGRAKSKKSISIRAFKEEKLDPTMRDLDQPAAVLGSKRLFETLRKEMMKGVDVLVYVHGFNVKWNEAVGAALSLQILANHYKTENGRPIRVVLFTWPSDGLALPFVSYKSDRTEAEGSGLAFARGFLKLRDQLMTMAKKPRGAQEKADQPCKGKIHLLCHSMGNYVLQHALRRISEFTSGTRISRIFDQVFLCAPDVDDTVLEPGEPLYELHETCRGASVYYNKGDLAMYVSDYTKGNPERLGTGGAAHPGLLHAKISLVDCSEIVTGLVEHSYYLVGTVNRDICQTLVGWDPNKVDRNRRRSNEHTNVWVMT